MAVANPSVPNMPVASTAGSSFYEKLNLQWHENALRAFMLIVFGHWGEHLFQAYQIYVMGWPRPMANGMLGMCYPWLVKTEILHYGYALVMLIGIWVLRKGFTGISHTWWMIAFWIQFWHHIEHFMLIWQATTHHNFWGRPVPCSFLQLFFPRVELHLFYNTIVFIPMVIAMYYHVFPPVEQKEQAACTCAWHRKELPSPASSGSPAA